MNTNPHRILPLAALAFVALLALPAAAVAQSELDASEAQVFLGDWTVPLQTPQGNMEMSLVIEDQDGKVAAQVGVPQQGTQEITDIRRAGESLVLSYDLDAQGMVMPISLTLRPDGDNLSTRMDVGGGLFTMDGTAQRAGG